MGTNDSNATGHTSSGAIPTGGDGELPPGTVVGEYTTENVLGRGGFGTVYRAVHPLIGKRVAIKVLSRRYSADEDMVRRFIAEARAVNQIQHRNIIDIFSFGQLPDGRHYYVMEHLDGEPLDQYLATRGSLTVEEAVPILRAIARALGAAHAKGIAHRDLKPENIFLVSDEDGRFPKLLDFGIAKLSGPEDQMAHKTGTGVPLGTPYYMSPEQCRGRDVDVRTDIYSFGVLTYRVLTGTYPFEGELIEILHKQMHEEPPPPSSRNPELTPEVDDAIAWMMRKAAADRPSSVMEGVAALAPGSRSSQSSVRMPVPTGARSAVTGRGLSGAHEHALTPTLAPGSIAGSATVAATSAVGASVLPPAPARRGGLVIGVSIAVIAIAGAVAFFVLRGDRAPSGQTAATPPLADAAVAVVAPDAAVIAAASPDAAPEPPPALDAAAPQTVVLTIKGAPKGTEVWNGKVMLGVVPRIAVPGSPDAIELAFKAPGYKSTTRRIVPTQDQDVSVELTKVKKIKSSDDIENPF